MINLDIFASILAGLGLFFVGIKGIAANLSQLAGRSLRQWVAGSTGSYPMRVLVGTLAGALTQSTNAVTVILMSLATADLVSRREATPILVWANVGTAALVLLVAVDIHLFVLVITAAAGLCYYLHLDRSPRWRSLVAALLASSLLFLGLELMRSGANELREVAWVRDSLQLAAHWYLSAFIVGVGLAVLVQSSATVAVMAIAMASAGLLTLEQSMMTVFGASVGSGISTYLVASGVSGTSRQLPLLQASVKILGIALLLPIFFVERALHVPLLASAIRSVSSDPGRQVAFVYLACQIAAVVAQLVFDKMITPLIEKLAPPSLEEAVSKPRYIYHQALSEPETALTLVDREQARVFGFLPLYLGVADHLDASEAIPPRETILSAATALDQAIGRFLNDLADANPSRDLLEQISNRQARSSILQSIHESLSELGDALAIPFETPAMQSLCSNLSEGLAGLLLTADDAIRSGDAEDLSILRQLTSDRDSLVDQLRRRVIAADRMLSARDQHRLYTVTSLFERIVWMLRRYGALLSVQSEVQEAPVAARLDSQSQIATLS
jgi:phosphate:Na+ symporter